MKKIFQNRLVRMTSKILTLMGFSLVFAACYAPAPMEPELIIDDNLYYHTEEPTIENEADEANDLTNPDNLQ